MIEGLDTTLTELERLLNRDAITRIEAELREVDAVLVGDPFEGFVGEVRKGLRQVRRLLELLGRLGADRRRLGESFTTLSKSYALAEGAFERESFLVDFLALFTERRRLAGDRAALGRFLDLDAVRERYLRHDYRSQVRAEIVVRLAATKVARLLSELLGEGGTMDQVRAAVRTLDLEARLLEQIFRTTRWQSQVSALVALRQVVSVLPRDQRTGLFGLATLTAVSRCCFNRNENTWVQRAAIDLLREIDPREIWNVYRQRLRAVAGTDGAAVEGGGNGTEPPRIDPTEGGGASLVFGAGGDGAGEVGGIPSGDLFVRVHLIRSLAAEQDADRAGKILKQVVRGPDGSEYVRMEAARGLSRIGSERAQRLLRRLAVGASPDQSPRVRATAIMELRKLAEASDESAEKVARVISRAIRKDDSVLVRRVAFSEAAALAAQRQRRLSKLKLDQVDGILLRAIDKVVIADEEDVAVRRLAGEAREEVIVRNIPAYEWVLANIMEKVRQIPPGGSVKIPASDILIEEDDLGRILAHFTREDFDVCVAQGARSWTFYRGDRFRRRLWRLVHEMRHPSPDKRQGFGHTIGRDYRGTIRAHSGVLAELTQTKVPGERVFIEAEGSWRRHIPLLDDYLSLFRRELRGRPVKIFSSLGVTTIRNMNRRSDSIRAYYKLCWNYAAVANLRNANPRSKEHADVGRYFEVLREDYGLETAFRSWEYQLRGRTYPLLDASLDETFRRGQAPVEKVGELPSVEREVLPAEKPLTKVGDRVVAGGGGRRRPSRPERRPETADAAEGGGGDRASLEETGAAAASDDSMVASQPMGAPPGGGGIDDGSVGGTIGLLGGAESAGFAAIGPRNRGGGEGGLLDATDAPIDATAGIPDATAGLKDATAATGGLEGTQTGGMGATSGLEGTQTGGLEGTSTGGLEGTSDRTGETRETRETAGLRGKDEQESLSLDDTAEVLGASAGLKVGAGGPIAGDTGKKRGEYLDETAVDEEELDDRLSRTAGLAAGGRPLDDTDGPPSDGLALDVTMAGDDEDEDELSDSTAGLTADRRRRRDLTDTDDATDSGVVPLDVTAGDDLSATTAGLAQGGRRRRLDDTDADPGDRLSDSTFGLVGAREGKRDLDDTDGDDSGGLSDSTFGLAGRSKKRRDLDDTGDDDTDDGYESDPRRARRARRSGRRDRPAVKADLDDTDAATADGFESDRYADGARRRSDETTDDGHRSGGDLDDTDAATADGFESDRYVGEKAHLDDTTGAGYDSRVDTAEGPDDETADGFDSRRYVDTGDGLEDATADGFGTAGLDDTRGARPGRRRRDPDTAGLAPKSNEPGLEDTRDDTGARPGRRRRDPDTAGLVPESELADTRDESGGFGERSGPQTSELEDTRADTGAAGPGQRRRDPDTAGLAPESELAETRDETGRFGKRSREETGELERTRDETGRFAKRSREETGELESTRDETRRFGERTEQETGELEEPATSSGAHDRLALDETGPSRLTAPSLEHTGGVPALDETGPSRFTAPSLDETGSGIDPAALDDPESDLDDAGAFDERDLGETGALEESELDASGETPPASLEDTAAIEAALDETAAASAEALGTAPPADLEPPPIVEADLDETAAATAEALGTAPPPPLEPEPERDLGETAAMEEADLEGPPAPPPPRVPSDTGAMLDQTMGVEELTDTEALEIEEGDDEAAESASQQRRLRRSPEAAAALDETAGLLDAEDDDGGDEPRDPLADTGEGYLLSGVLPGEAGSPPPLDESGGLADTGERELDQELEETGEQDLGGADGPPRQPPVIDLDADLADTGSPGLDETGDADELLGEAGDTGDLARGDRGDHDADDDDDDDDPDDDEDDDLDDTGELDHGRAGPPRRPGGGRRP